MTFAFPTLKVHASAGGKNRNAQPGFISKPVDRLTGEAYGADEKSVRDGGEKARARVRERETAREKRELRERRVRTLVCGRIRRECDRAREGNLIE